MPPRLAIVCRCSARALGRASGLSVDKIKAAGGEAMPASTDIAPSGSVRGMIAAVVAKQGTLDILVNYAAMMFDRMRIAP